MFSYNRAFTHPLTEERIVLLEEGVYTLTFLGVEYVGDWRQFVASFLTESGEERHFLKSTMSRGRSVSPFPILSLWRALGAPYFLMNGGHYPPEEEWRPYIGRRVNVNVEKGIGLSGKEFALARWSAVR